MDQSPEGSLRQAAKGLFDVGVGINDRIAERVADHRLLLAQFSMVTPENCMKPAKIQAAEGRWDFAQADGFNDYNNELPAKRAKQLRLLRSLLEKKVPIHAVGLQGHYELDRVPFKDIEDTIVAMSQLGVKVVISELDIDVIPRGKWWADGGKHREELSRLDPYRDGCPVEVQQRQADQYVQLFRIFRRYSDTIVRVSFWNLHDGESWLNDFPWKRVNHPLLFDRQGHPKPALAAVISALKQP